MQWVSGTPASPCATDNLTQAYEGLAGAMKARLAWRIFRQTIDPGQEGFRVDRISRLLRIVRHGALLGPVI